jgi:hypothetical protein
LSFKAMAMAAAVLPSSCCRRNLRSKKPGAQNRNRQP